MLTFRRTTSENPDFQHLITLLDADIHSKNYTQQGTFDKMNVIENNQTVIVVYDDETAIGCGCFKKYDEKTIEIKRMFVSPSMRGKRIAGMILNELEAWAKEFGYNRSILETGAKQSQAIIMYQKEGFERIPNFGVYEDVAESFCFGRDF